jgi:hypothetical protein
MNNKDEKKPGKSMDAGVEGEGSYTADRRYREGVQRSEQAGRSDELAKEASKALDGPEGAVLREAEERAKRSDGHVPGKKGKGPEPVPPPNGKQAASKSAR